MTLSDKVLEWLRSTGFPLEMEAAAEFRNAGFDVRQSGSFTDPQSNKGREIDVLAQDPDLVGIIEISFVVECKSSSTKPWVVLMSDHALSNFNRLLSFGITSVEARKALASRFRDNSEALRPYLDRSARCGYGFRQALGNADLAYAAAMSAIKACHGIAQDSASSTIPRLAFAFPVIVVDSPLFECSRRDDGELDLVEVAHSDFLFSAHIPDYVGCCIKVVTRDYLPKYAKWAKELADRVRQELQEEEKQIFEKF